MKFILIGGSGFVGRHLAEDLTRNGQEVLICDLSANMQTNELPFLQMDIRDINTIYKVPFAQDDVVINLAANQYHLRVPRKDRDKFFCDTNTYGVKNLLTVILKSGCKSVIQFTTDMVYGKPDYLPVDTMHKQRPFGPYGQSKKDAEIICNQFRGKGLNITIFRPRMIIGPGRLGILKKLFWLIGHNLPVPMIGNGMNHYQMISVFDCVSAIKAAVVHKIPNAEYNLGSANPPFVKTLLANLITTVGSKSRLIATNGMFVKSILSIMGRVGMEIMYKEQYMIADEDYILDISKTERDLKWTPAFSDQDMIFEAYKSYLNMQLIK